MTKYSLRLLGPEARGARISAGLLKTVLDVLTEGARGAVRLRAEGRSTMRGTVPGWLVRGADFDVLGFRPGSTVVEFEAPVLREAAPERFGQGDLLLELHPEDTALGLFQASLADALEGKEDSDLFDEPLLARFEGLNDVFSREIATIELTNGGRGGRVVTADAQRMAGVARLRRSTPPDRRVRLAGWLDAIRHSDRMFTLKLETGATLRGVAEGVPPEHLASLFGKKAVVSAIAVFRPSGTVLRLDADQIEPAGENFSLWSREPRPLSGPLDVRELRQPQGPRSGINAIIGRWPSDESDEEVAAALEDLS